MFDMQNAPCVPVPSVTPRTHSLFHPGFGKQVNINKLQDVLNVYVSQHAVRAVQTYCKKYRPVVAVKVLQILVCGRNVVAIQNVCCDQKPVLTLTYICMRRCLRTHWWALSKEGHQRHNSRDNFI